MWGPQDSFKFMGWVVVYDSNKCWMYAGHTYSTVKFTRRQTSPCSMCYATSHYNTQLQITFLFFCHGILPWCFSPTYGLVKPSPSPWGAQIHGECSCLPLVQLFSDAEVDQLQIAYEERTHQPCSHR